MDKFKLSLTKFNVMFNVFMFTSLFAAVQNQSPQVIEVTPHPNSIERFENLVISVTFDQDMKPECINETTFFVNSSQTGFIQGKVSYDSHNRVATFVPSSSFRFGETVNVTLTSAVQSLTGIKLEDGYGWTFSVASRHGLGILHKDREVSIDPAISPIHMVSGDFNHDGLLDLVAGSNGPSFDSAPDYISFILNDDKTDFSNIIQASLGNEICCVYSNDFDKNGYLDLAAVAFRNDSLVVIFNFGNGLIDTMLKYPAGSGPIWVDGGDFDNDGDVDLLVANIFSSDLWLYSNDGKGLFTYSQLQKVIRPHGLSIADLNNDGKLDWTATSDVANDSLVVFFNIGNIAFARNSSLSLGLGAATIWGGDFNIDSYLDLVVVLASEDKIAILLNNGDGGFSAPLKLSTHGLVPTMAQIFDLNLDGYSDIIVSNGGFSNAPDSTIAIFMNDGHGGFSEPDLLVSGLSPKGVVVGDFDNDGDLDLAAVNAVSNTLSIFINDNVTSVDDPKTPLPQSFTLSQNYPNPFNPETQIEFEVPERGRVSLKIFNLSGQLVRTLKNEMLSSGTYSLTWDGRDDFGKDTASGVYLYRMRIGELSQARKMILIR